MTNDRPQPGYKQTEVGVIPEDWKCESLAGKILITHGFGFQSQYFSSQGSYHLTTPGNFYEEGGFRELGEKQKYYEGSFPDGYLLRPGDLIVAMTEQADGLLGSAAIIPETGKYLHNQRLGKVTLISSGIELGFLYYIFNSRKFRAKVQETAAGTKVNHTSPNKLLEIAIPYPSPGEQRSIAKALSDVDALIAALDKAIAKNRHLKTATMQQLLTGKKRLPGFGEGKGYKESSIGIIPEDWEVKAVGEVCDFIVPGRNKPRTFKGDIPWITTPDLEDGRSISKSKIGLFVSRDEAKNVGSRIVPPGSVLMSCVGELGIVALVEREIVINQQLHAFIPSKSIDSIFLLNALQAQKEYMLSIATITAVPYLNKDNCNSIPIPLPKFLEQRAIATVLSDMDTEIAALETRIAKTQALKQGMMQALLTGRIRLA